jgi:hypothetical protein
LRGEIAAKSLMFIRARKTVFGDVL